MFEDENSHLTINGGARLRIWQGGIVNNDCTTVNYLTIVEDAVNDVYGEFLLHPDVTVNNHPLASVELISCAYYISSSSFKNQRFSLPKYNVSEITATYDNSQIATRIWGWAQNHSWDVVCDVNTGSGYDPENLNNYYSFQLSSDNSNRGTIVTFIVSLTCNGNKTISNGHGSVGDAWGNLFSSRIKSSSLLSLVNNASMLLTYFIGIDSTIVDITTNNVSQYPYLNPTQACIIKGNNNTITLSYKDLVWDPSFEEEITPTLSLSKGSLMNSPKPVEIDTTLEGSGIFDNPEPIFPPEHDGR